MFEYADGRVKISDMDECWRAVTRAWNEESYQAIIKKRDAFQKKYNCIGLDGKHNLGWNRLVFKNKEAFVLFMLRWG